MFISSLKLWNFRKYGSIGQFDLNKPNLMVPLKNGMNILLGENDSGKTAIIDAIKLVLKTHAYEWIKLEEEDFYSEGDNVTDRVRIEIEFSGITDSEASNFIEWCGWKDEEDEPNGKKGATKLRPKLILIYQAELKDGRILPTDVRAGMDGHGHLLTAEAKEFLKITYLKPLRDANSELTAKKNSRLSQILKEHKEFKTKDAETGLHEFEELFKTASDSISDRFKDKGDKYYNKVKKIVDDFIQSFLTETSESQFNLGATRINNILEKISLGILGENNLGLGTMNRLFMAAELLHLKKENWNGLKLCVIEELEAHLHPQAQLKIINRLKEENDIQYLLTTHSPNISSQVNLKDIIICKNNNVYPLDEKCTALDKNNYKYLERFLDVTKSNLFFSKGNIIVEGWSEEILLPVLAKKIEYDLTKSEISIINVGSTAYLHFTKIFLRKDNSSIGVPIAIISDLDNRPDKSGKFKDSSEESVSVKTKYENLANLKSNLENSGVILEIAKEWTLEWCLYKSCLSELFKEALSIAHPKAFKKFTETEFIASLSKDKGKTKIDKVKLANELAILIESDHHISKADLEQDQYLGYLIKGIKHVCTKN